MPPEGEGFDNGLVAAERLAWRAGAQRGLACGLLELAGAARAGAARAGGVDWQRGRRGDAHGCRRAADSVAGYALGPGDRVRLTVFRHEDLSGEFDVDGEGFLAMPLVGEIRGAGMNARQLESEIEARLKEGGYLVNPQVSIEVLNYRPFYIIGEVNNPGSYQYVNGMNVINAVALAGGFSYRADQDDIVDHPRRLGRQEARRRPARHAGAAGRHHRGDRALLLTGAGRRADGGPGAMIERGRA